MTWSLCEAVTSVMEVFFWKPISPYFLCKLLDPNHHPAFLKKSSSWLKLKSEINSLKIEASLHLCYWHVKGVLIWGQGFVFMVKISIGILVCHTAVGRCICVEEVGGYWLLCWRSRMLKMKLMYDAVIRRCCRTAKQSHIPQSLEEMSSIASHDFQSRYWLSRRKLTDQLYPKKGSPMQLILFLF